MTVRRLDPERTPQERVVQELCEQALSHTAEAVEQFSAAVDALLVCDYTGTDAALQQCQQELRKAEKLRSVWQACLKAAAGKLRQKNRAEVLRDAVGTATIPGWARLSKHHRDIARRNEART